MTAIPVVDAVIKTCRCCGRAYDAAGWVALALCGYVGAYEGESGESRVVELRNCSCRSTIGIDIPFADNREAA